MKSALISIQPKWCELIASGKKMVEVRKNFPNLKPPFKVYIYETLGKKRYYSQPDPIPYYEGKGKVIGEFVCNNIFTYEPDHSFTPKGAVNSLRLLSCLSASEIWDYSGKGKATLYGWSISDLVIYDDPKELSEFYKECAGLDNTGMCYECENAVGEECDCAVNGQLHLTRPPQSWCYVEG